MELQQRINAFSNLGDVLRMHLSDDGNGSNTNEVLSNALSRAEQANGWFDQENLNFAVRQWAGLLTPEKLSGWMDAYDASQEAFEVVGIVTAGNIPLVGFHDLLSVLICGSRAEVRLSKNDQHLLPALVEILETLEPGFKGQTNFTSDKLAGFDAVIATGSNNTARYFDHYFGRYPHIIRRNRNGVAVLDGSESTTELEALAEDIFRYYGLGCRNVSKIFIPEAYDFDPFFNAMFSRRSVINHHKYMNNYDYNKAVYLMSDIPLLDNEFMLLKEDSSYASPIGVVYHETYKNLDDLVSRLSHDREHIQCVVSKLGLQQSLQFGQAQLPALNDYADGVDTVDFVLNTSQ